MTTAPIQPERFVMEVEVFNHLALRRRLSRCFRVGIGPKRAAQLWQTTVPYARAWHAIWRRERAARERRHG